MIGPRGRGRICILTFTIGTGEEDLLHVDINDRGRWRFCIIWTLMIGPRGRGRICIIWTLTIGAGGGSA